MSSSSNKSPSNMKDEHTDVSEEDVTASGSGSSSCSDSGGTSEKVTAGDKKSNRFSHPGCAAVRPIPDSDTSFCVCKACGGKFVHGAAYLFGTTYGHRVHGATFALHGVCTEPNHVPLSKNNNFCTQECANHGPTISDEPTPSAGVFGQPSSSSGLFGQPTSSSGGFGQPSSSSGLSGQPSSTSGLFGQPSSSSAGVFGQPSSSSGGFGQPSSSSGVFGQPNPFAYLFGQPSSSSGGFGQPSSSSGGFGQPTPSAGVFGQPTPSSGDFGQRTLSASGSRSIPQSCGLTRKLMDLRMCLDSGLINVTEFGQIRREVLQNFLSH